MATIQTLPPLASDYKAVQSAQIDLAIEQITARWRLMGPRFDASWMSISAAVVALMSESQRELADRANVYTPAVLAQTGQRAPDVDLTLDPERFAGVAGNGVATETALAPVVIRAKQAVAEGHSAQGALVTAGQWLAMGVNTILADTMRAAESTTLATYPTGGYIRVVSSSACIRCVVQAGKWFRWNKGFLRHPRCRCTHLPASKALGSGMVTDPYALFNSLDDAGQIKLMGSQASAQAIRDGADIFQVANARRGLSVSGRFTAEGMSRRGFAGSRLPAGYKRLTPDLIYERARVGNWSRERTVEELSKYGYITGRGQVGRGVIRGQREGFGQMGAGGARRAAREAIEEARRTGVRDPLNRYTMTAEERRTYDVLRRAEVAASGRSPFTSPGFGNTPDPYGLGLNRGGVGTRAITAAERDLIRKDVRFMERANPELVAYFRLLMSDPRNRRQSR